MTAVHHDSTHHHALSIELEIIGDSVVGQVAPAGRLRITVEIPEQQALQIEADELGCFSLTAAARGALGRGPLRFQIEREATSTAVSDEPLHHRPPDRAVRRQEPR